MKPFCLVLIFCILLTSSVASAGPLSLVDVLRSVEETHPGLVAARAEVEGARAETMTARGAFDLKVYAEGQHAPLGKYDKSRGAIGLSQPTTLSGLELWARYENGANFAPYDGDWVTSEAGKASMGVVLPLLRGRGIDEARLLRLVSDLQVVIAEEQLRQTRASILAEAAATWWQWVIAGRKLTAYEALLLQAEERRSFLEAQVTAGAIPRVELVDNLRVVAGRRAKLAAMRLEFRQLCLALGLYRRTETGAPSDARFEELPSLPEIEPFDLSERTHAEGAVLKSPGMRVYEISRRIVENEVKWAENQALPQLDLEIFSSQSYGNSRAYSAVDSSVTETAAGGKLKLSWDVQRRKARGKAASLRAKLGTLEAKSRQLKDKLFAALQGQWASLEAQLEIARLSREATRRAGEVTDAERQSFELGQSSLLALNLREQATISTYLEELDAVLEYQHAWVKLQEILGNDRASDYLPPSGGTQPAGAESAK